MRTVGRGLRVVGALVAFGALVSQAVAAPPAVSAAQAQELYRTTCQKCHGPEGNAPQKGEGLSFADGEWNHGADLRSIVAVITNGVPETGMRPFKDKLSAAEIQALAKYVRSLDKHLKE